MIARQRSYRHLVGNPCVAFLEAKLFILLTGPGSPDGINGLFIFDVVQLDSWQVLVHTPVQRQNHR